MPGAASQPSHGDRKVVLDAHAEDNAQIFQAGRDLYVTVQDNVPQSASALVLPVDALPVDKIVVGRTEETADLLRRIDPDIEGATVAIVTGSAGIGKTTLLHRVAVEAVAAGRFPGGAIYVDMRGYSTVEPVIADQVWPGALRALGARGFGATPGEQAVEFHRLLHQQAQAQSAVLLVLDNVASGAQVQALLPSCAPHRVLIGSRSRLSGALLGAGRVELGLLSERSACELIVKIVGSGSTSDARPTWDPSDLRRLVELCGGLPLALSIAAALIVEDSTRPIGHFVEELEDASVRLSLLDDGERAVRAAFEISYRALNPPEARLFRLLSWNPGPDFSLAAAAALADDLPHRVRSLVGRLDRLHLLERTGPERRRMHDLIRLYAIEQRDQEDVIQGWSEPAALRLLHHYRDGLVSARQADVAHSDTDWVESEFENLIGAVPLAEQQGHGTLAVDIARFLADPLADRGRVADWLTVTDIGVRAVDPDDVHTAGVMFNQRGNALRCAHRLDEAEEALDQAIQHLVQDTDTRMLFTALGNLGGVQRARGRFAQAQATHEWELELCNDRGDALGAAAAHNHLGLALRRLGQLDAAIEAHLRAVELHAAAGSNTDEVNNLSNLGLAFLDVGQPRLAHDVLRSSITLAEECGSSPAPAWNNLGHALRSLGDLDMAVQAHLNAAVHYSRRNDLAGEARARLNAGTALTNLKRYEDALTMFMEALEVAGESGDVPVTATVHTALGQGFARCGEFQAAEEHAAEGLRLATRSGDSADQAKAWQGLGFVVGTSGDIHESEPCFARAAALFELCGDRSGEVHALWARGLALRDTGRPGEAIVVWEQALGLYRILDDLEGQRRILGSLTRLHLDRSDVANAEASLEALKKLPRK